MTMSNDFMNKYIDGGEDNQANKKSFDFPALSMMPPEGSGQGGTPLQSGPFIISTTILLLLFNQNIKMP